MFNKNKSSVWCYFTKNPNEPNEAKSNKRHTVYKHGHGTSYLHWFLYMFNKVSKFFLPNLK